jgi:hypothetical protein
MLEALQALGHLGAGLWPFLLKAFVCCCNTVSRMVMFIEFFR